MVVHIPSPSLAFERGAAQKMADIYNPYPPQRTQIIQNGSLSVPTKLNKIWALANQATDALAALLDRVNAAEQKIKDASQPANVDASEAAVTKVRWAFDSGLSLSEVCRQLVEDNDKDAMNALTANLGLLARMGKLGDKLDVLPLDKRIKEARASMAVYYQQLAPRDEVMRQAEVEEVWNMGRLRASFKELVAFFQTQLRPEVIAGQQNRIEYVNAWLGLGDERVNQLRTAGIEWERLPKAPKILLVDDLDRDTLANLAPLRGN